MQSWELALIRFEITPSLNLLIHHFEPSTVAEDLAASSPVSKELTRYQSWEPRHNNMSLPSQFLPTSLDPSPFLTTSNSLAVQMEAITRTLVW